MDQARAPARDAGLDVDHEADHLARELDRSQEHLAEIDTRLHALDEERAETRWYQRGRRQEIDLVKEGWERGKDHWQTKVDDLTKEIEERPPRAEAHLERARDFPSASSFTLRMTRAPNFEPAPPPAAPDIDIGLDL